MEYKILEMTGSFDTEENLNRLAKEGYRVISTVIKGYFSYIILGREIVTGLGEKGHKKNGA